MKRQFQFICLLVLCIATGAFARNPDGALSTIQTPNNGLPVITTAGQNFTALLREEAKLSLRSPDGKPIPITITSEPVAARRGCVEVECGIGHDTPPGAYELVADTGGQTDINRRAVYVVEQWHEEYTVAHVTDTHVGSDRNPRSSVEIAADVFEEVNKSDASFVLVTGDLTDNGELHEFKQFLKVLDTCRLPTFVCPGNHDRLADNYENFFGAVTYMFRFGQDGYLAFDTKDYVTADALGVQDELLQRFRRAIKPARWSIGFTHRYEPGMGIRSQIILFVDNPLDHLVFGHWHRKNEPDESIVPWGKTSLTATPAAINGALRYIDVTRKGIIPGEPVRAVKLR